MKFFLRTFFFFLLCTIPGLGYSQVFQHISDKEEAPKGPMMSISQDNMGFMWYGSTGGLFRYDTHTFKHYSHNPKDNKSIAADFIKVVFSDSKGMVWVGTYNGLSQYDNKTQSFKTFTNSRSVAGTISSDTVNCIVEDKQKNLWIGTAAGLNQLEVKDGQTTFKRFLQKTPGLPAHVILAMAADEKSGLWLATTDGLIRFDHGGTKTFKPEKNPDFPYISEFGSIYNDGAGNIWLGVSTGGLMRFNITSKSFEFIKSFRNPDGGWPIIQSYAKDKDGKLWIASMDGLANFNIKTLQSRWFVNDPNNEHSLGDNALTSLFKDREDGLWLGSYDNGIDYINTSSPVFSGWPFFIERTVKSKFRDAWMGFTPSQKLWLLSQDKRQLLLFDKKTNRLTSHNVNLDFAEDLNHFYIDEHDILWCGGNLILKSYDFRSGLRKDYPFPAAQDTYSGRGRIYRMIQDRQQRLWCGGSFGLMYFDKKTKVAHGTGITTSIASIFEDSKGDIWVGGRNDVWHIPNGSQRPERIVLNESPAKETAGTDDVWRVSEDRKGRIWIATLQGLRLYDSLTRKFTFYPKADAKLLANIHDIETDQKGYLWLSRGSDLLRYHPDAGTVQTYSYPDGLPRKSFLPVNTTAKDEDGILYFNTNQEMFSLDPRQVKTVNRQDSVIISSLRLFNKEVLVNDENGILDQDISLEKEIVFRYDQNIFTLDFALLNYSRSNKNLYRYRLEGFEDQWNEVSIPTATYMNLLPGQYTFEVRAANGDGFWSRKSLRLSIVVLPPWWKTWLAYLTYALLVSTGIYFLIRFFWLRTTLKKDNELYQAKLDFFTNVSHEIRTHLSLISGPVEKAYAEVPDDSSAKNYLTYARNNSGKLMQLVNELLDFRKIQTKSVRLHVQEYDVTRMLKNISSSFDHFADEKGMKIQFKSPDQPVMLWFDLSQMQKVFYNLLSNAYKFTPEGGAISVEITESDDQVTIQIKDNGTGIAPHHLDNIFTNFFQVGSNNDSQAGSGIGLALSKEIISLHKGDLSVSSQLMTQYKDGETCFTVRLIKGKQQFSEDQLADNVAPHPLKFPDFSNGEIQSGNNVPFENPYTILLIEDNDELRAFEKEIFGGTYSVLDAANGMDGLKMAFEHLPDLILCDVMMPELNGIQVCRQIKSDIRTSHIPVILLTARSEAPQVLEGLEAGADDYLLKPFDPHILDIKVRNLIKVREELRSQYLMSFSADTQADLVNNVDSEFIAKLSDIVVNNLPKRDFGVNEMAIHVGMSVSVLYRKLRALTGMTVNDFIKMAKMKRAFLLLEAGNLHVNEVAFLIGYDDTKYFSKEFKKIYGKSPSQVKKTKD